MQKPWLGKGKTVREGIEAICGSLAVLTSEASMGWSCHGGTDPSGALDLSALLGGTYGTQSGKVSNF